MDAAVVHVCKVAAMAAWVEAMVVVVMEVVAMVQVLEVMVSVLRHPALHPEGHIAYCTLSV